MTYIANAFSAQMLSSFPMTVTFEEVAPQDVPVDAISCVGHPDTANVVSDILGRQIEMRRVNIRLNKGDIVYLAQITGGRLPEGATTLPAGYQLVFLKGTLS